MCRRTELLTKGIRIGSCETLCEMELFEQFKQSAQALELLHERKMWNEQKPYCLSAASLRFLRMLFHILSECQKFLARKPFECSYNFHETQIFPNAYSETPQPSCRVVPDASAPDSANVTRSSKDKKKYRTMQLATKAQLHAAVYDPSFTMRFTPGLR